MSRCLLGATIWIENLLTRKEKSEWTLEEEEKVKKFLENSKNFQKLKNEDVGEPRKKKLKFSDQLDVEIESAVRLLVQFSGFEAMDAKAVEKLKNVYYRRFLQSARQLSAAERRKKDGLQIPYKSPVEWTLKLNGVQKVLEIKKWYDSMYLSRWREVKETIEDTD